MTAALLLLTAAPVAAQSPAGNAAADECETDLSTPLFSDGSASENSDAGGNTASRQGDEGTSPTHATEAEDRVRAVLAEPGIHVVRLWAPWCKNSTGEMAQGWDDLLDQNPDVSFTFVTVWNNGRSGTSTMERYGLADGRITEVVPADPEQGRLDAFMGYALTWVPSTWIFRTEEPGDAPERAFALNYGEMDAATLQTLLDAARADW